jgi:hypothetical protein
MTVIHWCFVGGASSFTAIGCNSCSYVKLNEGPATVPFKRVNSTKTSDILAFAKDFYHVEDGKLIERVSVDEFVECAEEVSAGAKLLFDPVFYTLKCRFSTLNHTKSLRLLAKAVANSCGKMTGTAVRVSAITVEVQVSSPERGALEAFFNTLGRKEGIQIEGEPTRTVHYGVLHGRFHVQSTDEENKRTDGVDSFEREGEARSSENSCHFYS